MATLCASATPARAVAQGLQYTQRATTEMGGPMAAMMPGGGQPSESESHVYVLGSRMRTDTGDQSSIVDMEAGTLVMLRHDERTFVRVRIDELMDGMASVRVDTSGVGGAAAEELMPRMVPEITSTDERQTILGYEARRTIVSMGSYPANADTSETSHLGRKGVSWPSEGSTARSSSGRR